MAKLSEAMIKGLRKVAAHDDFLVHPRTLDALRSRDLIMLDGGKYAVTQDGAYALAKADHAEREAAYQAGKAEPMPEPERERHPDPEPECREGNDPPHPIGAPGCVLNGWEDSSADLAELRADADFSHTGPSVRLTPAPPDVEHEATDAEVLQLLAVLDAGGSVHRALYQQWGVLDAGPFRLNLDAVNRAARDAVRFALARQTFKGGEYTLTAEPIHLDAGNGHSACGFPLAGYTIRHRVTSDPAKVTHERCRTT